MSAHESAMYVTYISNNFEMKGSNILDINQINGIKLITRYWSKQHPTVPDKSVMFVGDIHGDLHQFLAPLVLSGLITLTGKIINFEQHIYSINEEDFKVPTKFNTEQKQDPKHIIFAPKYDECDVYIPDYTINIKCNSTIIFLGDFIDEWVYSRNIICMLSSLYTHSEIHKNIITIFGNHDLGIIGRYAMFRKHLISIPEDLPTTWNTMKRELRAYPNVRIIGNELTYKNKADTNFVTEYVTPLFEEIYHIFRYHSQLAKVCFINDEPVVISHTIWSSSAIEKFVNDVPRTTQTDREHDNLPIQSQPVAINGSSYDPAFMKLILRELGNYNSKIPNGDVSNLISNMNKLYFTRSNKFMCKNNITYTRTVEKACLNQVVGHTPGGWFRDIGANPGLSQFNSERLKKLEPTMNNNCKLWYFDFGVSAGYDRDEISRPDFVYTTAKGFEVTNLDAFKYCLNKDKYGMNVYDGKTRKVKHILLA